PSPSAWASAGLPAAASKAVTAAGDARPATTSGVCAAFSEYAAAVATGAIAADVSVVTAGASTGVVSVLAAPVALPSAPAVPVMTFGSSFSCLTGCSPLSG